MSVAARQLSSFFARYHLPLITGLLFIGILSGPFVFNLVSTDSWDKLNFVNEISLAYIAFAASAELYLKELRSRLNSIKWMTIGQLVVTFLLSSLGVYLLIDLIPFTHGLDLKSQIAISILTGTIFIARSPASAMAIINEMRAKGPFTQTVIGVTVLIDFLVVVLFSINLSIAIALTSGEELNFLFLIILLLEIGASFGLGLALGKLLQLILRTRIQLSYKGILMLLAGFLVYRGSHYIEIYSLEYISHTIVLEPLLICIIGSFWITNYTRYRLEFTKILNDLSSYIYIPFFTLVGISLSLDLLLEYAWLTALFFTIRLVSIMIGSFFGGKLANDSPLFNRVAWMPYVTQAGVGLGLATIVAHTFPEWGFEFSTFIISIIIVNQVVGPPLFKWVIRIVKEGHSRATTPSFDGLRDAIIFGWEDQSVALAKQLQDNGWVVKLVTLRKDVVESDYPELDIRKVDRITLDVLNDLDAQLAEAAVCMLTDDENFEICELIYEHFGTRDVVVRLNHRYNFEKFHELGTLIVDPSTAIVSLLDHFVRSPQAASLLLGMEADQDSMDIEVQNQNLHGLLLRDLRLPSDTIVLSMDRKGRQLITHGYTRLRKGDYITIVGSKESLDKVALRFARQ